jgi:hypothetical protein
MNINTGKPWSEKPLTSLKVSRPREVRSGHKKTSAPLQLHRGAARLPASIKIAALNAMIEDLDERPYPTKPHPALMPLIFCQVPHLLETKRLWNEIGERPRDRTWPERRHRDVIRPRRRTDDRPVVLPA